VAESECPQNLASLAPGGAGYSPRGTITTRMQVAKTGTSARSSSAFRQSCAWSRLRVLRQHSHRFLPRRLCLHRTRLGHSTADRSTTALNQEHTASLSELPFPKRTHEFRFRY
jgi:hypothetical protein